ncbi:MAG: VPLPA-CTERM sorting domain-containing protein [Pedobacter sp.]
MKRLKFLLVAALFALTTIAGVGAAHASLGVDFTNVADNTNTKTGFGSDINIIGWAFSVNQSFDIRGLGYFANNGILTESHDVALYRSTGELVASVTVNSTDELLGTAQWRFHNIPTTNLSVGNYVIAATVGNDLYTFNPNNITWNSEISYTGDVFDSTNSILPLLWTSTESVGSIYGVDAGSFGPNFVATPIPAAVYLLGSGLLGLAGIRRKQNI